MWKRAIVVSLLVTAVPAVAHADALCGMATRDGSNVPEAVGAGWVRTSLYWPLLEPSAGSYNYGPNGFGAIESALAKSSNTLFGIEMFADYLGTGGSYRAPCSDSEWLNAMQRWQALWTHATSRYCASNPNNQGVARYWSVWNEPNDVGGFLRPRAECTYGWDYCKNPDPYVQSVCSASAARDYADLIRYADAGRRAGCPNDTVLVVGEVAQSPNNYQFTHDFLSLISGTVNPGVLAVHSYTFARLARDQVQKYRSPSYGGLDQYFPNAEIWMTEAGGPELGLACSASGYNPYDYACFGKRAGFLRSIYAENRQYASQLKWRRTFIFRSVMDHVQGYGLTDVDWAGNPIGQNLQLDSVQAACNSVFAYMDVGEYNDQNEAQLACLAIATSNSGHCNNIAPGNGKQLCLAMASRSQSPCASMTDRNLQLACYGMSIKWPSNCRDITNPNQRNLCYAASTPDINYCHSITDRNTRSLCYAMATGTRSYCNDISTPNDRNFCHGISARDTSACYNIVQYPGNVQR